jgi:hypothetical protein
VANTQSTQLSTFGGQPRAPSAKDATVRRLARRVSADATYGPKVQTVWVNTVPVSNTVTGSLQNLMSWTIPAGLINTSPGDCIEVDVKLTFAVNGNNKSIAVLLDSTSMYSAGPAAQNGNSVILRIQIFRVTSTTVTASITAITTGVFGVGVGGLTGITFDMTQAHTIHIQGESATANGDVTCQYMSVRLCQCRGTTAAGLQ